METIEFMPIFTLWGKKGAVIVPKNEPTPPIIKPTEIAYKLNNNATNTIKGPNTITKLKKPKAIAASIALNKFVALGFFSASVILIEAL